MAQKKYRLTDKADPFLREGQFKFTVGYDKNYGTPPLHVRVKNLPVVTLPDDGIVVTTNEFTQKALALMMVPQRTERNGQKWPSGYLFEDITGQPGNPDVDLDTILT